MVYQGSPGHHGELLKQVLAAAMLLNAVFQEHSSCSMAPGEKAVHMRQTPLGKSGDSHAEGRPTSAS